ncbi:MAG: group II truncated hemoglobin [Bermanella sp.]|jgi:Truncated hemoglobins
MMSVPYGTKDVSYQAAGQFAGLIKLVDDFYGFMQTLPEAKHILEMHDEDLTVSKDKLARFLSAWTGGPRLYKEKYGAISIPSAHSHLAIGSSERDAWLLCMEKALALQPYEADFKRYLITQLALPASRCKNRD